LDRGAQRGHERVSVHRPQRLGRQRSGHQLVRPMPRKHDKTIRLGRIERRRFTNGRASFRLNDANHDERTLRSAHRPFGECQVRCEVLIKRPDRLKRTSRKCKDLRAREWHCAGYRVLWHRHRSHVEHAVLATSERCRIARD
jgi:hypothetical protein